VSTLLTEQEVSRSWQQLIKGGIQEAEVLDRLEVLIDELRPESPLRHRLSCELSEIRSLAVAKGIVTEASASH
jgi:hypothetical protein